MKKKEFLSLGLMTGTSMDGLDLSLIKTDGYHKFSSVLDNYFEFDDKLQKKLINLRDNISTSDDLKKYSKEMDQLEREITLFHSRKIINLIDEYDIDLIGFHGQTIFHNPKQKISKQLGNGKLLSQISKKIVINNFRQNDLNNDGQGAPLTPIFHRVLIGLLKENNKIALPVNIINIGGITNITQIYDIDNLENLNFTAFDIGPGNCLIDNWIRKNSKLKFDKDGEIANSGKVNDLVFNQAVDNFGKISYKISLDVKDFDISFAKGLSLEDGCATVTKFSAFLIAQGINYINTLNNNFPKINIICGGGRKNSFLIKNIYQNLNKETVLKNIDDYGFNGDFIESQCFGYLAVRSYLNLPISFPNTTGCSKPTIGGTLNRNF